MTLATLEHKMLGLLRRIVAGDNDAAAQLHKAVDEAFTLRDAHPGHSRSRIEHAALEAVRYLPCGIEKAQPVGDRI